MAKETVTALLGSESDQVQSVVYSILEFCENYKISRGQFYIEWWEGRISPKKIGKRVLIPVAEAERWLASFPDATPKKRIHKGE